MKLSLNKVKRIEDPESFLRRSVLINNTIKRLQREVREEKMMRHGGNGGGYLSRLSLHSSFRKSFTSSSKLNEINLCASEDLIDDDIPLSPPSPTIIPSLPCISTTSTSFTSTSPSSTTCHQLVDPLSNNNNNVANSSDNNSSSTSGLLNGSNNNNNSTNSRKRMLSDDSEDDCDVDAVLSQIYIPPTPCIISNIDDEDCTDSTSISSSGGTLTSSTITSSSSSSSTTLASQDSTMSSFSSSCGPSEAKKPRLSSDELILNENGNDNYSSSCNTTNGIISYSDTLKSFSTSSTSAGTNCNTVSFYSSPPPLSSSSSVDTIVDVDGEDVDIDVDVVGDCETSDWPTLPTHYESISSTSTTVITTTSTVTTTTTTNSCLTIPIHQFSLDDELDLSTPSPCSTTSDPFDSIPDAIKTTTTSADPFESISETFKSNNCSPLDEEEERNNSSYTSRCSSNITGCQLSECISSTTNNNSSSQQTEVDDEMNLLDNTKENTCTLPFYCPSSTSSSTYFSTNIASYCYSPVTSAAVLSSSSPDQLKCSNNSNSISSPFSSTSSSTNNNITADSSISFSNNSSSSINNNNSPSSNAMMLMNSVNNNNNNNGPNMDDNSLDKQPPASPSQYSSCGQATIFGELQSVVFHSLITSLET